MGGALLLWTASAFANPLDAFGFGSRATALANAVSADTKDFSANYYNPAGLACARGLDLSLGYVAAQPALTLNGRRSAVDPVRALVGGMVAPGTILGVPFALGVGIHVPDARLARDRARAQEEPRWELYDNRPQRLFLAANAAVSPWPWLQVGGGVAFLAGTRGRLDVSGGANVFRPNASELRHEVDAELTAVRYPQVGARLALGRRVALALVYRGEFKMDLGLDAKLHGDLQGLTTVLYELQSQGVSAFAPQQVVLGSSFLVTDDLRANVDFTWVDWSAYVPPVSRVDVALDIPTPEGGWPPTIAPPTTPAPTRFVPLVLRDRIVPHLGIEWRPLARAKWEGFLRGGYEYHATPIAPQTGETNYVDRDRHAASLGIGLRTKAPLAELPGDLRLDAHVQYSALPERVTAKLDPADLVGDYRAGGHLWNMGITVGVGF